MTSEPHARDDMAPEEGREEIRAWREERRDKKSRTAHLLFYLRTFNLETIHSFAQNITLVVILQMLLAAVSVYICQRYTIFFDIHVCLFVSPIVFPLAFCINTDFQRREKVLEDLANFRSSSMIFYFCMRDWKTGAQLTSAWLRAVQLKVKSILFHLREYLLTSNADRRKVILCAMYEDYSDVNQLIEKVRASKLPSNTAIVSRAIHLLNMMVLSFERLRVVREYRSPRSIRSFNKIFIAFLPMILAPYFVGVGIRSESQWQPYCVAVLMAFVFSTLQGAQDNLDDPFDGMSEDDIRMNTFDELDVSLEHALKRTFAIGRFVVSFEERFPMQSPDSRRNSCRRSFSRMSRSSFAGGKRDEDDSICMQGARSYPRRLNRCTSEYTYRNDSFTLDENEEGYSSAATRKSNTRSCLVNTRSVEVPNRSQSFHLQFSKEMPGYNREAPNRMRNKILPRATRAQRFPSAGMEDERISEESTHERQSYKEYTAADFLPRLDDTDTVDDKAESNLKRGEIPSSVYYQQSFSNDNDDDDSVFEHETESMMTAWEAVDGVMRREIFANGGKMDNL